MKIRILIVTASFSLLFAILMIGCTKAAKAVNFNGTWVNEKIQPQMEVDTPDEWKQYTKVSDTSAIYAGKSKLISQWTDSEGNVWVKWLSTFTKPGWFPDITVLDRYSKNGTVREGTWNMAEGKNPVYPSKIDPHDPHYSIYYRQEK